MEMSDHYEDLAASSGYAPCSDCWTWYPIHQLTEQENGEQLCHACRIKQRILWLVSYEEKALAADDPAGGCAANHRGAISAYKKILAIIEETR